MKTGSWRRAARAAAVAVLGGALSWGAGALAEAPAQPPNPHGSYVEECSLCHRAEAWSPVRISPKFNHAKFGFPLDAAHAQTACRACHVSLDFSKVKPESSCVGCHEDAHQGELGQDCARCHTARSFIDRARMARAHNVTRFPLSGAHLAVDCEACHKPTAPGHLTYVDLRTDCDSCHLNDYNATTNPNHATANFSHDCAPCHSTVAWARARYTDHDPRYFPIYSGAHLGKWTTCADCHVNATDFSQFECILCHAHSNQAQTTSQHTGVSGFAYNSQACYSCHPRGRR